MFTPFAFIKRQVSAAIATIQKVLIAGEFTSFRTISYGNIIKINSTTAIDTTFNMGSGTNTSIFTSTIDENGKILIGGDFTSYSGSSQSYITRINTDGTRDTTFRGEFNNSVYDILPVSQSKILIGGSFSVYSGSNAYRIVRVNSNGNIDTTFQNPGIGSTVYTVATQSDGKIIVGGNFTNTGYYEPLLAKINSQLDPDTTFNPGAGPNGVVYAFASQSDGKLLMGGTFTTYSGSTVNRITRINTDGTRDTTFNVGTGFSSGEVDVIRVQPDNKILVGGSFTSYSGSTSNRIIRINTDGTRDTTFNIGTGVNSGQIYDLQLQSDNKIIAVGSWSATYSGSTSPRIVRINTDGTRDLTFNPGTTGFSATQYSAQIQNDGKIIVVGVSATYSGSAAQRIRRINTNGTLDTTFNIGTAGLNNTANRAKIQPDQKIVVLGAFTSYSGSAVNRLARINPNGTRDLTFNVGTGFNTIGGTLPIALELDSSGNIYAGSNFTTYNNISTPYFVKLNSSGSIITGSGLYKGFDNTVNSILVDSTGSVYTGGSFNIYISPNNYIVRLNTDGTKDFSFQIGTGFNNTVYSLTLQSDNKIVVGGNFTTYSGSANNYIVRLNTDGTKDTSFNIGTAGFNGTVYKLTLQSDNKILVGGNFTTYSGSANNYIVRLNSNGTKDTSFNIGTGTTNIYFPQSLVQDQSGNIHYGNRNMTSYSGSSVRGYVKLTSSGSIDPTFLSTAASASSTPGAYTLGTVTTGVSSISIDSSNNAYLFGNFQNYLTPSSSYLSSSKITAIDLTQGNISIPPDFGTGFNNNIYFSSKTPSGDIWLTGNFSNYKGSSFSPSTVVKINSQGTLINTGSFPTYLSIGSPPTSIFAQSDGKCLVAFMNIYGLADIIRLNSDGTLDTTFASANYPLGYGYLDEIRTLKQQSNGDILLGGSFKGALPDGEGGYTVEYPFYLTKINSSGSNLGLNYPSAYSYVNNINILPDDSFIVTGEIYPSNGGFIQKWDSTGSIDNIYNPGLFNGIVYTSTLQPDQKIIAAGAFTSYSGSAINRIARINTNGTLDTTFNPGSGFDIFNNRLSKIVVDQENNIHVVGPFTTYSGSIVNGYVKIQPNGNIDPYYTGPVSGSGVGIFSSNFANKDAYTIELINV